MAKILIIGVGESGNSIVDRMAKENMQETNFLKVKYSSDESDVDSGIPALELAKEDDYCAWTPPNPEFHKLRAEEMRDEIKQAILDGFSDNVCNLKDEANACFYNTNQGSAYVSLSDKPDIDRNRMLTYKVIYRIGISILAYIGILYLVLAILQK